MKNDFDIVKETGRSLGFEVKKEENPTEIRLERLEKITKHLTDAVTTMSEMQKLLHEKTKTIETRVTLLRKEIE